MTKKQYPESIESMPEVAPAVSPALAPAAASAPVAPVAPTNPSTGASSGRPGCGYTLLIVIVTVICTLIIEAVLFFAAVAYIGKKVASSIENFSKPSTTQDGKPKELTKDQKVLLQEIGIDPAELPPEIPAEKVGCAIEAIGEQRLKDIIAEKATPGFTDLFKLRNCL